MSVPGAKNDKKKEGLELLIVGRVWVFGHDIDTDLIFPQRAFRVSPEEQARLVFSANRPGWAEQVKPGDLIVAGRNFGTGSSRPAAAVLKRLGLGGLVADSMNGLFFRSCVSYGLPALQVEGVSEVFMEGDIAEVDLRAGLVKNRTTGRMVRGHGLPDMLLNFIRSGGILPLLEKEGYLETN